MNASAFTAATTVNSLNLNSWNHIVGQFNGTDYQIYLNGFLEDETADTPQARPWAKADLNIGGLNTTGTGAPDTTFLAGDSLCDIRLYNRVLSPNEIRLLATRPGIAYERKRQFAFKAPAAVGGLSIPIAAYHYNHNIGANV